MKITFDIELADDNYGRLYINATSVENLNKIVECFRKTCEGMTCIKDEPSPKQEQQVLSAEMGRFKNEIRVGPVKFDDGKTGYFYVKVGNSRIPNVTWEDAMYELEYSGFSVPTKEELALIIRYKDLIDSIDISEKGKFSEINDGWIWTSSECYSYNAWVQRSSDGYQDYTCKTNDCWLVPFMRVIC